MQTFLYIYISFLLLYILLIHKGFWLWIHTHTHRQALPPPPSHLPTPPPPTSPLCYLRPMTVYWREYFPLWWAQESLSRHVLGPGLLGLQNSGKYDAVHNNVHVQVEVKILTMVSSYHLRSQMHSCKTGGRACSRHWSLKVKNTNTCKVSGPLLTVQGLQVAPSHSLVVLGARPQSKSPPVKDIKHQIEERDGSMQPRTKYTTDPWWNLSQGSSLRYHGSASVSTVIANKDENSNDYLDVPDWLLTFVY
jgi:hypothetical protein